MSSCSFWNLYKNVCWHNTWNMGAPISWWFCNKQLHKKWHKPSMFTINWEWCFISRDLATTSMKEAPNKLKKFVMSSTTQGPWSNFDVGIKKFECPVFMFLKWQIKDMWECPYCETWEWWRIVVGQYCQSMWGHYMVVKWARKSCAWKS